MNQLPLTNGLIPLIKDLGSVTETGDAAGTLRPLMVTFQFFQFSIDEILA
jgi:hypothetical protein